MCLPMQKHIAAYEIISKKKEPELDRLKIQRTEDSDKLRYRDAISKIQSMGNFRAGVPNPKATDW